MAWAVGLVALGLTWSACSSDEAEGTAPISLYGRASEFCSAIATASCSTEVANGCGVAQTACVTAMRQHCNAGEIDASRRVAGIGNAYQADQAEICVRVVETAHQDAILSAAEVKQITDACDVVFSPRSGPQGPCSEKADCNNTKPDQPQLDCFFDVNGSGLCTSVTVVAPGEPCGQLGAICQSPERYYCNGSNCIAGTGTDTGCSPGRPCIDSQRCVADPTTPAGAAPSKFVCAPKKAANEVCESNEECLSGVCTWRRGADGQRVRNCLADVRLNNVDAEACKAYQQLAPAPGALVRAPGPLALRPEARPTGRHVAPRFGRASARH
ncbi:MAG TPA: hypothetical protein VFS00_17000 [Polyangiaceae bacterium]|nr:hypothetical protein [Polyangiaceae bacterium]